MEVKKIGVIAGRHIALGFKLVGVKDVFIAEDEGAIPILNEIMNKDYDMIFIEERLQQYMNISMLIKVESSIHPLVIFIPSSESNIHIEPVEKMAKRVLGVNIKGAKK